MDNNGPNFPHEFSDGLVNEITIAKILETGVSENRLEAEIRDLFRERHTRNNWQCGTQQDLARIIYKTLPYPHLARHTATMLKFCDSNGDDPFDDATAYGLHKEIAQLAETVVRAGRALGVEESEKLKCLCGHLRRLLHTHRFAAGLERAQHGDLERLYRHCVVGELRTWLETSRADVSRPRLFENRLQLSSFLRAKLRTSLAEFYALRHDQLLQQHDPEYEGDYRDPRARWHEPQHGQPQHGPIYTGGYQKLHEYRDTTHP